MAVAAMRTTDKTSGAIPGSTNAWRSFAAVAWSGLVLTVWFLGFLDYYRSKAIEFIALLKGMLN